MPDIIFCFPFVHNYANMLIAINFSTRNLRIIQGIKRFKHHRMRFMYGRSRQYVLYDPCELKLTHVLLSQRETIRNKRKKSQL